MRRRRNPTIHRVGLLFASPETYQRRIWRAAYDAARADGKSIEAAREIADEADRAAKDPARGGHDADHPNTGSERV